jgi:hypothetical protein
MRYALCWPHLASPLLVRAKRGKEREDVEAAERERWPATAPHLGAEEQGQQPAEGGGRGVAAELWGPPPRRRVRSSATCCACAAPAPEPREERCRIRILQAGPPLLLPPPQGPGLAGDGLVPPVEVVCRAGDGLLVPLVEADANRGAVDDGAAHGCTTTASRGRAPSS